MSARLYVVRTYVRPSVRPQKSFLDFNEIWHVGIVDE